MKEWRKVENGLPEEDRLVESKIDDAGGVRNQQNLKLHRNLWFYPDLSMYVYYTPTHWRYV